MAFLDNVDRTLSQLGQSAIKKTKDMSETVRLSNVIRDEEEKQAELFRKMGEYVYQQFPETIDEQLKSLREQITSSKEKVRQCNEQLNNLKGSDRCPGCGAITPSGSVFCSTCGVKIEDAVKEKAAMEQKQINLRVCPNCGRTAGDNAVFCTYCGTKIPEKNSNVEQEEKVCPACGSKIEDDQNFCTSCGMKIVR